LSARATIVIPAYEEGQNITQVLNRIIEALNVESEIVVVVDSSNDSTIPFIIANDIDSHKIGYVINTYGPGPGNAIRFGIEKASTEVVVVTMADGSDDVFQIDSMVRLIERGVAVVSASRYTKNGRQVGGPFIKSLLSRLAGVSLFYFGRVGTRDATNSFKAYSKEFINQVGIESDKGFEIGIELVAKARRNRMPVAEIPTIWIDRTVGVSRFRLLSWIPVYFKWYFFAIIPWRVRSRGSNN
jgi:glycosyltransferase involved in cell wall biosynthesis